MMDTLIDSLILIDHFNNITRNTKDFNPKKHTFVTIPYNLT